MRENLSLHFEGAVFDSHDIPAAALAQSLLAFDSLATSTAESMYGKGVDFEVKVKGGFRAGSFIIDFILANPVEVSTVSASVATILMGVCSLAKWAFGKKVTPIEKNETNGTVTVRNEIGHVETFNQHVVNIYNNKRTSSHLARLTQSLDQEGATCIKLLCGDANSSASSQVYFIPEDREYLRQGEGAVVTDNEATSVLEIIGPMFNGSPRGWRFSDGDDGVEFSATVEDDAFLEGVKNREIIISNGTSILAVVRTIQRQNIRTRAERSIVEVKKVRQPKY